MPVRANRRVFGCCRARLAGLAVVVGMVAPEFCGAVEVVRYRPDAAAAPVTAEGRVVVEDEAGTVCVVTDDGSLHVIDGATVVERFSDARQFTPLTPDAYAERLLAGMPPGFAVYQTPRYVVAYRTSRGFARWTASTLERLHKALVAYWRRRGLELHEPEFPLGVVVHATAEEFAEASLAELGRPIGSAVGYYNLQTNRVRMYDLSGAEAARASGGASGRRERTSLKEINQMLATPAARPLVATVVHEATHQAAYNTGIHQRFAELPLWLVEGMAVYFEAPDLSSGGGWRGIGNVNYPRLQAFRENVPQWGPGALVALVSDDRRMRDPRSGGDAYADAWALNYYLIRYRPRDYFAYVRTLAKKRPLVVDPPGARMETFRQHFGDPAELQRELIAKMRKVR